MKTVSIARRGTKRLVVVLVSFALAGLATPALATSYPGSWGEIFGNSTSCAFVRGSINDESHKAGGITKNVAGCSSPNNAPLDVPPSYLGLRVRLYTDTGYVCSQSPTRFNTSTTSSLVLTTSWAFSAQCNTGARYFGSADGQRKRQSSGAYFSRTTLSPSKYFSWSRQAEPPAYDLTKSGLTVGDFTAATPEDKRPVLAARTGVHGKGGFIRVADVFPDEMPASPQEAAQQEAAAGIVTTKDGNIYAPVYAGDGKTMIDRLLLGTVAEGRD